MFHIAVSIGNGALQEKPRASRRAAGPKRRPRLCVP